MIDVIANDAVFPAPRRAHHRGRVMERRAPSARRWWVRATARGPGWGEQGHAWLTERWLTNNMYGLACLMEECDVPRSSAAA